jgi:hypothetical protein
MERKSEAWQELIEVATDSLRKHRIALEEIMIATPITYMISTNGVSHPQDKKLACRFAEEMEAMAGVCEKVAGALINVVEMIHEINEEKAQ